MATIRNSITMEDRMSSTFKNITKAMQSTLTVMQRVDAQSNNGAQSRAYQVAQRDINRANNSIINLARNTDRVETEANQSGTALRRMGSVTQSMSAMSVYALMAIGQQFMQLIKSCTDYLDKLTLIEARLNLINDGLQSTGELQDKILASANRARMSYSDMASSVAKLNMLASDFFNSNDEAIAFVETLNKMFVVSGTGAQEASAAMYQLTQAMGGGKLQGDEFRSIMENAPMLADAIATQMGKTKGELKELSSKGLITADIIKAAMFNSAEDINKKFASMPKTFGQMMQVTKNYMMKAMEPVAKEFSEFINSAEGEALFTDLAIACVRFADVALKGLKLISQGIAFMKRNWESIKPVIMSVAILMVSAALMAAGAWVLANWPLLQLVGTIAAILYVLDLLGINVGAVVGVLISWFQGFVALLEYLLPLIWAIGVAVITYFALSFLVTLPTIIASIWTVVTGLWAMIPPLIASFIAWLALNWPILLVAIAVGLLIFIMGQFGVTTADVLGFIMGLFFMLGAIITNIMIFLYNIFGSFAVFIGNLFINPLAAIKMLFLDMGLYIIDTIHWVAKALENLVNMIPGVEVNITAGLESIMAKIQAARSAVESESGVEKFQELDSMDLGKEFGKGFNKGSNFGASLGGGGGGGISLPKLPGGLDPSKFGAAAPGSGGLDDGKLKGGKLDEVGKIKDDVTITDEDIKMLKDIASTEFVNSYTTLRPKMNVSFGDVRETADVNGILSAIETITEEALNNSINEEVYA